MAQDFFSTGFTPASPNTTGARGSDSGRQLQFDNVLIPEGALSTGAPGSDGAGSPVDAGLGTVAATDVFGHLNGTSAPPVHGSTATSQPTGSAAVVSGTPNPTSTGMGEGHVTNGSERIH